MHVLTSLRHSVLIYLMLPTYHLRSYCYGGLGKVGRACSYELLRKALEPIKAERAAMPEDTQGLIYGVERMKRMTRSVAKSYDKLEPFANAMELDLQASLTAANIAGFFGSIRRSLATISDHYDLLHGNLHQLET